MPCGSFANSSRHEGRQVAAAQETFFIQAEVSAEWDASYCFFFDGSSNRAVGPNGVFPTNVYYLNQAFTNGDENSPQISFYFSGVGTRGDRISAATGRGFDEIVIEAYINLASNYVSGDQIYLFGFSRGAAAARMLSAMISDPGLLKDTRLSTHFPDVWALFTRYPEGTRHENKRKYLLTEIDPSLLDPQPKIEFIGAFDTVPGYSWDRQKIFTTLRIRNLHLERCVKKAVQVLAADDNRLPSFRPLLWDKKQDNQTIEQIWLPGVHGDVGGHSDGRFIGNIALLTMIERVEHYCPELDLDRAFLEKVVKETFDNPTVRITNERPNLLYKLLFRGMRKPGGGPGEHQHELLSSLSAKRIVLRDRGRHYRLAPYWEDLPVFTTKYSDQIKNVVTLLPNRPRGETLRSSKTAKGG